MVGGGGWLRAILGSNPTVSHQLELEFELSVGAGLGFDKNLFDYDPPA